MSTTFDAWALKAGLFSLLVGAFTIVANAAVAGKPTPDHPGRRAALTAEGTPITVYTAKKVYTMDPGRPEADAVAVLDGKVLSTGRATGTAAVLWR